MTVDIAQLRRAINPCPGFMLTRDQTEAMQKLVRQLIAEHEQALAKLAEHDQWISLDEKWPEEGENVLVYFQKQMRPAFWIYAREGTKFRQWYSLDPINPFDQVVPFDEHLHKTVLWKPFPAKPAALMESLTGGQIARDTSKGGEK